MGCRAEKILQFPGRLLDPLMAGRSSVDVPLFLTPELFLQPKGTLLTEEIKHDWVHTADKIENIAGICQYISTVRRAFGKSLESSERVHLLIEAEEDKGDEDLETGSYPNAM